MTPPPAVSHTSVGAHERATLGLALLSFAAGSTDAIAFRALGGVFTSAMTGNTVLLGVAIGQGHVNAALHSLTALLGYLAGVSVASVSLAKLRRDSGWTLSLEALFLAAFAVLWLSAGSPISAPVVLGLIILSAVAMGMQGAIGRALGIPGIMTVVFTSTYTALVSEFVERALAGYRPWLTGLAAQQLATLAVYLGAALVGSIITTHCPRIVPFLPLSAILVLLALLRLRLIRFDPEPT